MYNILIVQHFIFDWLFQTRWMANNKSKSWAALLAHVAVVSLGLSLTLWAIIWSGGSPTYPLTWVAFNTLAHFVTDAITSRLTSRLYKAGKEKWFFTVIGFDQMIHYLTLFITAEWWLF